MKSGFGPVSKSSVVLIVEDEGLVRMDAAEALQEGGLQVREAANADEAVRIMEGGAPIHLLFTDIDMPGTMDGLQLAQLVASKWPTVRIIITSGHRVVEITEIPDGSVFFSKPYAHPEIIQSVRELLASSRP